MRPGDLATLTRLLTQKGNADIIIARKGRIGTVKLAVGDGAYVEFGNVITFVKTSSLDVHPQTNERECYAI